MLSNKATPRYYAEFKEQVLRGEIPICQEIALEMARIDDLIANPNFYYDDEAVEGWIAYCENELTLTDGSDLHLLPSFKLWAEQLYGWFYYTDRSVFTPDGNGDSMAGFIIPTDLFSRLTAMVAATMSLSVGFTDLPRNSI